MYSDPIPCTINDEMMRLGYLAEEENELHKLLHGVPVSESILEWSRTQEVEGWGKNPDVRNMKIVQKENGDMVAHAQWLFCSAIDGEEPEDPYDLHPEINRERYIAMLRDHTNKKNELMSRKAHLREYQPFQAFFFSPSRNQRQQASASVSESCQMNQVRNKGLLSKA